MGSPTSRERAGRLAARLARGPTLLLDGALGTELERHGADCGLPLWSARPLVEAPDRVARVHRAYRAAGAEVLTADTFRTQRRSLAHGGLAQRAEALTRRAVELAREAAGPAGWVAGSAPPLEDCYRPDLVPDDDALAHEHAEHARHLVAAGVDCILAETHHTAREAAAAVRAGREAGAMVWVGFVCDDAGRLLSGEPLSDAVETVVALGAAAVGVNCLPPRAVPPCLPALAAAGPPFFVQANLGAPTDEGGFARSDDAPPERFADEAARWIAAGAAAVGGCCGTTPEHVGAIRRRLGR